MSLDVMPVLLLGAGGHAVSVVDALESSGRFQLVGLVTSSHNPINDQNGTTAQGLNYPILGTDDDLQDLMAQTPQVVLGMGQLVSPKVRQKVVQRVKQVAMQLANEGIEVTFPTVIASTAYVSPHARLGVGCVVLHGAVVNAGASVGDYAIVNSQALIEHGCRIGQFCHIATGALVNGDVVVGDGCFIGSGAIVFQQAVIADHQVIPAGNRFKS